MQKKSMYALVLVLTLCLLGAVLSLLIVQRSQEELLDYVQFREDSQKMRILPHYDQAEGVYYLFLPAYVEKEDVSVQTSFGARVVWDQGDGSLTTLAEVPEKQDVHLRVFNRGREASYVIRIWQCTSLPTLSVNADNGILEYIHSSLDHEKDVYLTMVDASGDVMMQEAAVISGRGNSTWIPDKRPYNLKFSSGIALGPFQGIDKLCLRAEFTDDIKMRNALVYHAAQSLDIDYSSGYLHCNLYVNGEYLGIYGLTTKTEYEKNIVQDQIQSVFEYTNYEKENQFFTEPLEYMLRLLYGDVESTSAVVNRFCAALKARDWETCRQVIDYPSFARKHVLDEFFINDDMGFASQYFYINGQGEICAMLPWDFDWSMGSSVYGYDYPPQQEVLANRFPYYWTTWLLQDDVFRQEVVAVVEEYYTEALFQDLDEFMTETISHISSSVECDYIRWKNEGNANQYDGIPDLAHLQEIQTWFRRYYPGRKRFLADYYSNPEDYCCISFEGDAFYSIYVPKYSQLSDCYDISLAWDRSLYGEGVLGWQTEDGLTPDEVGQVTQDMTFSLVYEATPQQESQEMIASQEVIPAQEAEEQPVIRVLGSGPWLELVIVAGVAIISVCLMFAEIQRHITERKRKNKTTV